MRIKAPPSFDVATREYETWLARVSRPLVPAHLQLKHERMGETPFKFLRATFYRWAQHWKTVEPALGARPPRVLAVGDLHVENFGTWRDLEGRLIWGVNDFDKAYVLPAAQDLVRLNVSARFAIKAGAFKVSADDALEALLDGYARGLREEGHPFVLEEHNRWLRKIAMSELRDPATFWDKLTKLSPASPRDRKAAMRALRTALPEKSLVCEYRERVAGLGSLGRPRVVALASWGGGLICREAKAAAPSACVWALGGSDETLHVDQVLRNARRVRDPFYAVVKGWVVRRLAPHCSKIDVAHLPRRRDELELLAAMGTETANIHLGRGRARDLARVVNADGRKSIASLSADLEALTLADWKAWRSRRA